MEVITQYKTKAKWGLTLGSDGFPLVGYANRMAGAELGVGQNLILRGCVMLIGTSRGRSAAHFDLYSMVNEWRPHMTMKGTEALIHSIAYDETTVSVETWPIVDRYPDGRAWKEQEITAPVFEGWWTFAKQGTEISLIPCSLDLIRAHVSL
jgi:hypothetical protein